MFMIKSFKGKEAAKVFARERAKGISPDIQKSALRKLLILDAVERLEDLRVPPGNHLEKLSGDRRGQHSIRINDQWRICFRWHDGDAGNVEITDYH
jgi:proteic killer suppression protein